MKKIMISAGEVSGDAHATYLVRELKKLDPDIYFFGLGSEKLLAEGVDVKFDISKRGTIGILEALPNVLPIYLTYLKLVDLMKKQRPDLLLLVDSQGINMPLAKAAKRLGIKTVYYIAPQDWLWGTGKGVKRVAKTIDLIVAIFEKEQRSYQSAGAKVVFHGHPLLDIVKPSLAKHEARRQLLGSDAGPVIALCPGSRTQEVKGLLPVLLQSGREIQQHIPEARFLIPAASTGMIKQIFGLIGDFRPKAIVGRTYDILACADLAICTSGTINLEASILNTPNLMVYKLNPLTYFIGKHLLKIGEKLAYFSMPNLLLGEKIIPELVMSDAHPEKIAAESIAILQDHSRQDRMKAAFEKLKAQLGSAGVISRCARSILEFVS